NAARLLGVETPPMSVAELHGQLRAFRSELVITESAKEAAQFVLHTPPVARSGRLGYGLLTAGGVALLPGFARRCSASPSAPEPPTGCSRPQGNSRRGPYAGRWAASTNQSDCQKTSPRLTPSIETVLNIRDV